MSMLEKVSLFRKHNKNAGTSLQWKEPTIKPSFIIGEEQLNQYITVGRKVIQALGGQASFPPLPSLIGIT